MAVLLILWICAFVVGPALLAWCVAFYLVGYRDGAAAGLSYAVNAALMVLVMWLAVQWVPLLSLFGVPQPWFYVPMAIFGAAIGTASARRMTRPSGQRP